MTVLREVGACNPRESTLTPLGQHLAALPVNVRVGKMLVYGAMLGCLYPVVSYRILLRNLTLFSRHFYFRAHT